jgi:hypothetical protein
MKDSTRDGLIEEIAHETAHFAAAPAAFFYAWKSGVALAGRHLFGRGARADLEHATSVWDLCPKVQLIDDAIGVMSSGEKRFLAALVSFYNVDDGSRLFERVGVRGLADFGGLDLKRRTIIAALLPNYTGW